MADQPRQEQRSTEAKPILGAAGISRDPIDRTVQDSDAFKVRVDDYNESEAAVDPVLQLLPKELGGTAVTYFFWAPKLAMETEPLYRYARPVTRDGSLESPAFKKWLPDYMFAGGNNKAAIESGHASGHLYLGDLMCFWVPSTIVQQKYRAARKMTDLNLLAIARGGERKLDPTTGGGGKSTLSTDAAKIATHTVTID